jgi:hypothetical protein
MNLILPGDTPMKRILVCLTLFAVAASAISVGVAGAPADVSKAVGAKELAAAAKTKAEDLGKAITNVASFERAIEAKAIARDAGVIACLAQALAEHKDGEASGINATGLRDAALVLSKMKKLEDAKAALTSVNEALAGKGANGEKDHLWNKLVNMHRMMEEMELQGGKLRRVLKRPRRLEKYSENAAVLVVLGLAMEADTHEVKDKAKLPQWTTWSKEYHQAMSGLNTAIKAGDGDKAKSIFDAANETCDACHEVFRDK